MRAPQGRGIYVPLAPSFPKHTTTLGSVTATEMPYSFPREAGYSPCVQALTQITLRRKSKSRGRSIRDWRTAHTENHFLTFFFLLQFLAQSWNPCPAMFPSHMSTLFFPQQTDVSILLPKLPSLPLCISPHTGRMPMMAWNPQARVSQLPTPLTHLWETIPWDIRDLHPP